MDKTKEILHTNNLSNDTKKSMKERIIIGLLLFFTIIPIIFLGDYAFLALVLAISGLAAYEIIKVPQKEDKKYSPWVYVLTYLTIYIPFLVMFLANNYIACKGPGFRQPWDYTSGYSDISFGVLAFVGMTFAYFATAMFSEKFTINDVFYFIVMDGILLFGMLSFLQLRYLPLYEITAIKEVDIYSGSITLTERFASTTTLILYLVIGVCGNDIMAYFTGVLFGKHKMIPRISPKKTWEGFVGGVLGSALLSGGFAFALAGTGNPMLGFLDINHWYLILIMSLLLPLVATLGDLIFSAIKRQFDVKDFGKALRSHGGFLDRLDSILITSIAVTFTLNVLIKVFSLI